MFILNNNPLPVDQPFEHEGILYPANWLRLTSLEEKEAIGIIEVPDPDPVDLRFYESEGVERNLDEIKLGLLRVYNETVSNRLKETDWYIIRKFERGIDIPDEVVISRAALLSKLAEAEAAIKKAANIKDIKAVFGTIVL